MKRVVVILAGLSSLLVASCAPRPDLLAPPVSEGGEAVFVQDSKRIEPRQGAVRLRRDAFSLVVEAGGETVSLAATSSARGVNGPFAWDRPLFAAPVAALDCPANNLCVSREPLHVVSLDNYGASHGERLSDPSRRSYEQVIARHGGDAAILLSPRNFANVLDLPNSPLSAYVVKRIDGIPVASSDVERLWIAVFREGPRPDTRSVELESLAVSFYRVEFEPRR